MQGSNRLDKVVCRQNCNQNLKIQIELTGAALVGTKESMSFLMILPSGPVPGGDTEIPCMGE